MTDIVPSSGALPPDRSGRVGIALAVCFGAGLCTTVGGMLVFAGRLGNKKILSAALGASAGEFGRARSRPAGDPPARACPRASLFALVCSLSMSFYSTCCSSYARPRLG